MRRVTGLLALAVLAGCGGATSYPKRSSGGVRFEKFELEGGKTQCTGGASSGPGEAFFFRFTLAADTRIASLTGITIPPFATTISTTFGPGELKPCAAAPWTDFPETADIR